MDIRYRMDDVGKLRCKVCQDFLRLVIKPGWHQWLYQHAKDMVEGNKACKGKYLAVYEKMRDVGADGYSIDDMDVSIINELLHYGQEIAKCAKKTQCAMEALNEDRNTECHSSGNEKVEDLYLQRLLALHNLEKFVSTVDKCELSDNDEQRLAYRQKYVAEIDQLKKNLSKAYEEYIASIQSDKDMQKDIKAILDSDDRLTKWCSVHQKYVNSETSGHDLDRYYQFCVKASDAGISEAHGLAADYFLIIKKDYKEVERRLWMLYNASEKKPEKKPSYEMRFIVDTINGYRRSGNSITEGLDKLINYMKEAGYPIEKTEEGYYYWLQKKAN